MGETAMVYAGRSIQGNAEMLCLTDMWKANGSPKDKRPGDWLATKQAREFAAFLQDTGISGTLERRGGNPKTGDGGATWAHWQLAFAYAKYLGPEFHAWCNEVVRAHVEGRKIPTPMDSGDKAQLLRLSLLMSKDSNQPRMWTREIVNMLCVLYGRPAWTSGPIPVFMKGAIGQVYRIILGEGVYRELKRRNPHPKDSSLHYHWFTKERGECFRREDMGIIHFAAHRSISVEDFLGSLRGHYRRVPLQLVMGGAAGQPKRLGG